MRAIQVESEFDITKIFDTKDVDRFKEWITWWYENCEKPDVFVLLQTSDHQNLNLTTHIINTRFLEALKWLLSPSFKRKFPRFNLYEVKYALALSKQEDLLEFSEVLLEYGDRENIQWENLTMPDDNTGFAVSSKRFNLRYCVSTNCRAISFNHIILTTYPNLTTPNAVEFYRSKGITVRFLENNLLLNGAAQITQAETNAFLVEQFGSLEQAYVDTSVKLITSFILSLRTRSTMQKALMFPIQNLFETISRPDRESLTFSTQHSANIYRSYGDFYSCINEVLDAVTCYHRSLVAYLDLGDHEECRLLQGKIDKLAKNISEDILRDDRNTVVASNGKYDNVNGIIKGNLIIFHGMFFHPERVPDVIVDYLQRNNITCEIVNNMVVITGPIEDVSRDNLERHLTNVWNMNLFDYYLQQGVACANYILPEMSLDSYVGQFFSMAFVNARNAHQKELALYHYAKFAIRMSKPEFAFAILYLGVKCFNLNVQPIENHYITYQQVGSKSALYAFSKLIEAGIPMRPQILTAILENAKFAQLLAEGLIWLDHANLLTAERINEMCANPRLALAILNNTLNQNSFSVIPRSSVIDHFARIREVARVMFQIQRQTEIPTEVLGRITMFSSRGTLNDTCTESIAYDYIENTHPLVKLQNSLKPT